MSRVRRLAAAAAVAAGLCAAGAAAAQLAVFDPDNYAQNVLQAARALQQIANQVASLQNQTQMLLNQGRNLAPLSGSSLSALQADMARVQALVAEAGRVANQVETLEAELDRNYSGAGSDPQLAAAAAARLQNSAEAYRHLLDVQATVAATLSSTESQVGTVSGQSQAAVGALQAAQAGNQLLAIQTKQLADLVAVLSAQSRADGLQGAAGAASAAEARTRLARFLAKASPP